MCVCLGGGPEGEGAAGGEGVEAGHRVERVLRRVGAALDVRDLPLPRLIKINKIKIKIK